VQPESSLQRRSSPSDTVGKAPGESPEAHRILIVDDNPDIHVDFQKVLGAKALGQQAASAALLEAEAALLPAEPHSARVHHYRIDCATQGLAAVECVERLSQASAFYSVAFVDIRMPPGIDGVETAQRLWALDPDLQIVFCTAYSDYSWESLVRQLGPSHRFLVLKKPFDVIEARQLALALSEKRQLLRENQRAMGELEMRVQQRTAALEQAHAKLREEIEDRLRLERGLRHAQKFECLGRLAAGIGHEINNPLTYVMNNLELLQHETHARGISSLAVGSPRSAELETCIEEALLGARRIKQIVRGTRLFARVSDSPPTTANVVQCIRSALALVHCELRRRARLAEELLEVPEVVADSPQLEQIFVNLLLNAIQAIPARTNDGEIRVSCCSRGAAVEVDITDNGCGIPQSDLARIFDPFFSTHPVGEGTGLGLWVCKTVMEAFGGDISVESALGQGTRVRLVLAIAKGTAALPSLGA
jgi:signal transduction histidine kinase